MHNCQNIIKQIMNSNRFVERRHFFFLYSPPFFSLNLKITIKTTANFFGMFRIPDKSLYVFELKALSACNCHKMENHMELWEFHDLRQFSSLGPSQLRSGKEDDNVSASNLDYWL